MQHADTLTIVHHDDTRTRYTDVRYVLRRDGIHVWSEAGEQHFTDVLTTHVYRRRAATDRGAKATLHKTASARRKHVGS